MFQLSSSQRFGFRGQIQIKKLIKRQLESESSQNLGLSQFTCLSLSSTLFDINDYCGCMYQIDGCNTAIYLISYADKLNMIFDCCKQSLNRILLLAVLKLV